MAAKVIINFIAKALFKQKGAIANNKAVEFSSNALEQRLKNFGIDPNAIKNENELNQILSYVKQAEDQAFNQRFGNMLGGSKFDKQADVLDMTGKKIDPRSKIMGGQQAETEAEILARINKENKKGIANIKNKTTEVEKAIDNASPGFAGDRKYDAQLVADDLAEKRFGKEFYDLDQKQQMDLYDEAYTGLIKKYEDDLPMAQGGRAGFVVGGITNLAMRLARGFMKVTGRKPNDEEFMKIIREAAERDFAEVSDDVALKGVSETRATARRMDSIDKDELKKIIDEYKMPVRTQEQFDFSQGGRAGFKLGSIDKARRAFLKTVGAAGAGITALKTGLLGLGKEAAPAVEAVKETVTQAPSYFFDLVAKIKLLGEPRRTPSYRDRVNEYQYTGKDGNEYLLTEELDTGDIMIQKDKLGGRNYGDESYEVIEDRTEMVYRKGQADETTKGTPADDYEEYKVEFDQDGTMADATDIDEISKSEIIKEATGDAKSIKKAGGGIARMLGE